jgi:hypothetical protein
MIEMHINESQSLGWHTKETPRNLCKFSEYGWVGGGGGGFSALLL